MSTIVSIRVEEKIIQDIERLGYSPGEFLKIFLIRELKKEKSRKALRWIKRNRLPAGKKLVNEIIRKDRDSR